MPGNRPRTIFLASVSSWFRRSVRSGHQPSFASRPLKPRHQPHLRRGFLFGRPLAGKAPLMQQPPRMSTEIKRLEFELEKARHGLALPYDRERVWELEAQPREARQKVRMRK